MPHREPVDHHRLERPQRVHPGELVHRRGIHPRVHRAGDENHAPRLRRIPGLGQHRGGDQHRHRRLADREDVHVRSERAQVGDEQIRVVSEVELPRRKWHDPRVDPVGDVHVVVGQQLAHRLAEQRRVVSRERGHDQHAGIVAVDVPLEAQQPAERGRVDQLLADRDLATVNDRPVQAELRLGVLGGGALDHLGGGCHRPDGREERGRVERVGPRRPEHRRPGVKGHANAFRDRGRSTLIRKSIHPGPRDPAFVSCRTLCCGAHAGRLRPCDLPGVPAMLVKKYGNRRLYDTEESRYVRLDEIAERVRAGADVQVVDAKSGADLTAPGPRADHLRGPERRPPAPGPLLLQLIRMGDGRWRTSWDATSAGRWRCTSRPGAGWGPLQPVRCARGLPGSRAPERPGAAEPTPRTARRGGRAPPGGGGPPEEPEARKPSRRR